MAHAKYTKKHTVATNITKAKKRQLPHFKTSKIQMNIQETLLCMLFVRLRLVSYAAAFHSTGCHCHRPTSVTNDRVMRRTAFKLTTDWVQHSIKNATVTNARSKSAGRVQARTEKVQLCPTNSNKTESYSCGFCHTPVTLFNIPGQNLREKQFSSFFPEKFCRTKVITCKI